MFLQQNTSSTESQHFVSDYLVPTIRRRARVSISLHLESNQSRFEIEQFIRQKFSETHSATIRSLMPRLIALNHDDETTASIGIRGASENALFLEQYMDDSIEQSVFSSCRQTANRNEIVEIGNFAAKSVGTGVLLFTLLAESLRKSAFKWMAFTATTEIEKMISRLGCQPIIVSNALPEKLEKNADDWGAYYLRAPRVMICNLDYTINTALENKGLQTIFEQYRAETSSLACAIRLTNDNGVR